VTTVRPSVALIDIEGLVKAATLPPLRLKRLTVGHRDRIVLAGLGPEAAEMFVHLLTGAAIPDEGTIRIDGRDTRDIQTDSDWLRLLDRFGLVSDRSVLIEALTIEANMALPLTVSIDPVTEPVRASVRRLAVDAGIDLARLPDLAGTLSAEERTRTHLARALAPDPQLLLLEHPTRGFEQPGAARAFGELLGRISETRRLGWIAISDDASFARASGGRLLRLDPNRGTLVPERPTWFRRLVRRGGP